MERDGWGWGCVWEEAVGGGNELWPTHEEGLWKVIVRGASK